MPRKCLSKRNYSVPRLTEPYYRPFKSVPKRGLMDSRTSPIKIGSNRPPFTVIQCGLKAVFRLRWLPSGLARIFPHNKQLKNQVLLVGLVERSLAAVSGCANLLWEVSPQSSLHPWVSLRASAGGCCSTIKLKPPISPLPLWRGSS